MAGIAFGSDIADLRTRLGSVLDQGDFLFAFERSATISIDAASVIIVAFQVVLYLEFGNATEREAPDSLRWLKWHLLYTTNRTPARDHAEKKILGPYAQQRPPVWMRLP